MHPKHPRFAHDLVLLVAATVAVLVVLAILATPPAAQ
jgi:hypothetical protein